MAEDTHGTKVDGNAQEKDGYGMMATGYKPKGGTGGIAATGSKRNWRWRDFEILEFLNTPLRYRMLEEEVSKL